LRDTIEPRLLDSALTQDSPRVPSSGVIVKEWSRGGRPIIGAAAVIVFAVAMVSSARVLGSSTVVEVPIDGVTHRVQVRVGMQGQRFTPARLVATVGDSLRFELESGGPHNVAFDADSIPPGALEQLARNLGTEPRFLVTPQMLIDRGETFTLSLAGLPPGTYPFFCTPHFGSGMRGELVLRAR
jgi:plastocyanin